MRVPVRRTRRSRRASLAGAGVGALIVVTMLLTSCSAVEDGSLQAADMSMPAGSVVMPAFVKGGRAVLMRADGTLRGSIATFGAQMIAVDVAGDDCLGGPHMVVTVDGRRVIDTVVSSRVWRSYAGGVSLSPGSHSVAVVFDNHMSLGPSCDRDLKVAGLRVYAIASKLPVPLPRVPRPPRVSPPFGGRPHIMVIVEENREVTGVSAYVNALGARYGNASNWTGVAHPSLPNYLALVSGSTQGVTDDGTGYVFSGDNLGHQLSAAGVSWKAYMEDMPSPCFTGAGSGNYAKRHDPFVYFSNVAGDPSVCDNVVPFSQFDPNHLPDFVWITPNVCNDGHDCGNASVDTWLQQELPVIQSSAWYRHNGSIVLTWDEGDSGNGGGGSVKTVVLHGSGCGCSLTAAGNHYGTLRTIEEAYGLPLLGAASTGTSLAPLMR